MKNIKKIILASTMALAICSTSSVGIMAQEYQSNIDQPNISVVEIDNNTGVSYDIPVLNDNINTRATHKPSLVHNIAIKGRYPFKGESANLRLYTNYNLTGKTSYRLYIKNTGNSAITMTAKKNSLISKTYASTKVSAKKTAIVEFSNIKKDTKFYVEFFAEGNRYAFNGYVE